MNLTTQTMAVLFALMLAGCSDDKSPADSGSGGSTGGSATGGAGKSSSGGGGTPATSGGNATSAGTAGTTQGTFANEAACGERGMATVTESDYDGTAEFYIIGEAGLGVDVCTIRYDVKRVDAASADCSDCKWTHLVEYSNPEVVLNTDGACDASDSIPQLDSDGRAELDGMRLSRGFSQAAGHGDQLMKHDEAMDQWIAVGRASFDDASNMLGYDINTGQCNYGH